MDDSRISLAENEGEVETVTSSNGKDNVIEKEAECIASTQEEPKHDTEIKEASNENSETGSEMKSKEDPYSLGRADITSEKFQIAIRGLPKYYKVGELKKILNDKLKLGSNKIIHPARGSHWAYVCFRSEEDRRNALKALNGFKWKNRELTAEAAIRPPLDPLAKKRRQKYEWDGENSNEPISKKNKVDKSQEEILKDSTTPYWNVPYEEQITRKQQNIKRILVQLGQDMVKLNPALKPWLEEQKIKWKDLPCELWDVRPSPVIDGYRNKWEFSIGINVETGERTVGFRLGSYGGFVGIGPADCLLHIPQRMKEAAKVFEKFVKNSDLDVFNPITHDGYWRQLTARLSTSSNELMLVVGVHPQTLEKEQLDKLKTDLREFFESGEGKVCNIASLYFQLIYQRKSEEDCPPLEHLWGETHIHETLLGLKFRISPEAYFRMNTSAAEVLYRSISELSSLTEDTTLLDICCGTGSIGLCLAKKCGQVLGLELLEQAVNDAKTNATANNITNCEFFVGSAEDILSSVTICSTKNEILAVVDSPRAGLHPKALAQLRQTKNINKLVFVSCNPKAAVRNFAQLVRPTSKMYHGAPFVPVRAVPVDMFPHTPHCEMIVYFERLC